VVGGRSTAWRLLAVVAPELGEWAAFFAAGATRRAAAESGVPGVVSEREADDLLRDAETFLTTVETHVVGPAGSGPYQAPLSSW
ncbi:MAG TPA: SAV_6107 family HEPN domain-containing protein, partial [Mycobacteriales bacterium]|nr:SAV_6107 family HEPN domain-containing protein [Mycobacteriales bacterium]